MPTSIMVQAAHMGDAGGDPPGVSVWKGVYDDFRTPVDAGSGGARTYYGAGGAGGAALKLEVAGTLTVDGTISVDGNSVPDVTSPVEGLGARYGSLEQRQSRVQE
jgi:hypothetical protein